MNKILPIFLVVLAFAKAEFSTAQGIDYRHVQTPVKHQGLRGTCTAFGVAAALETVPAMPADVSEQYLYAALKHSQPGVTYEEGAFLSSYKKPLATYGVVSEEVMPYHGEPLEWESDTNDFTRLIKGAQVGSIGLYQFQQFASNGILEKDFIYYDQTVAHDIDEMKRLLTAGVPSIAVHYTYVHAPAWSQAKISAENPLLPTIGLKLPEGNKRYVDVFNSYEGDLTADIFSGKVPYYLIEPTTKMEDGSTRQNYGGHVVTIVGFNDKGFIFKNSWGTSWGDKGYGYISYAAHKIMAREALFFAEANILYPEKYADLKPDSRIDLKSTLFLDEKAQPQFYLTLDQSFDPVKIKQAEFRVYDSRNQELMTETITFENDRQKLLGFKPFEDQLMPPDFLLNNGHINVNVKITGENGLETIRYYRAITAGVGQYKTRDLENAHKINPPEMSGAAFNELFVFDGKKMGFNVSAVEFHNAIQNSPVDFNTVPGQTNHAVIYTGAPFKYAQYKFTSSAPRVLEEVELVFESAQQATDYFNQHYLKFTSDTLKVNSSKKELTVYRQTMPLKAQVWHFNNKIFMAVKLPGGKWGNL
ncbi:C1 family peptidase [Nonlabens xiamenensis]|uniref:C1 family peptidase n=1 Tax=Nonlabens xiamenensis TaxID=2341043 RepID=UPI00197DB140|nr:C1 family peptidase [Nonlabens xiamenensis]